MSIPLDKLYHYIESIAQDIRGGDVLIYRFYPHGSKKLENLTGLTTKSMVDQQTLPIIFCNDQEPLDYFYYENETDYQCPNLKSYKYFDEYGIKLESTNFKKTTRSIYDAHIVLHSELRSANADLYLNNQYIPVYYWCHALIALDWYRYGEYEKIQKNITQPFLIYNRAWSGTREYRLKFLDLLVKHNLVNQCKTTCSSVDPETKKHYTDHTFKNKNWNPTSTLEDYFLENSFNSSASADYEVNDYRTTDIEVVLETLFDDTRLHLTEKILRPIALGQPFILTATHGSLAYLRKYGFKTFSEVWDEGYDDEEKAESRLEKIVILMDNISKWSPEIKKQKMNQANKIAAFNKKHFYSSNFFNCVIDELKENLTHAFDTQEANNLSANYINRRKKNIQYAKIKDAMLNSIPRQDLVKILSKARLYYNRNK